MSAKPTEGEVLWNQCGVPSPAFGRLPLQGEDLVGIAAIFATAFRTAVFCSHLVARKGRKASDRCGDGVRSSGAGVEGDTRPVRGSGCWPDPPAVGVVEGKGACLAESPSSSTAGARWKRRDPGPGKALRGPPDGRLADNDGAERSASSKRYFYFNSGRRPDAPRPFPSLQRDFA